MFEIDQGLGSGGLARGAQPPEPKLDQRLDLQSAFQSTSALTADLYANSFSQRSSGPQSHERNPVSRRAALWIVVAIMLGAAGLWCRLSFTPVAGASGLRAQLDGVARMTGFGIDMVVLTGHKFTSDSDLFDALDLPNARSLVTFDTQGVRRRLERLPWVLTAELTRVFPDRLDVRVSERKAFAVWTREGLSQLIDRSGRVLSAIGQGKALDLPRLSGEGAAIEAERFLTTVERIPEIYSRLETAERVGERRWTLRLDRGVTIHLPPDREAAVLEGFARGGRFEALIASPDRIIDLRTPGRIAIRPDSRHEEIAQPPASAAITSQGGESGAQPARFGAPVSPPRPAVPAIRRGSG